MFKPVEHAFIFPNNQSNDAVAASGGKNRRIFRACQEKILRSAAQNIRQTPQQTRHVVIRRVPLSILIRQRIAEGAAFPAVDAAVERVAASGRVRIAAETNNVVVADAAVLLRGVRE